MREITYISKIPSPVEFLNFYILPKRINTRVSQINQNQMDQFCKVYDSRSKPTPKPKPKEKFNSSNVFYTIYTLRNEQVMP